jgi:DNA polymerase-3 subunit delta
MKLLSGNITALLQAKDLPRFILLYGPEEPEINITMRKIILRLEKQSAEELETVNLNFSSIKENPILLRDELASLSLLASNRLIIITSTAPTIGKDVIEIIKTAKGTAFTIFLAGDIAKNSSTRLFFEESKEAMAIACYKPDPLRVKKIIREVLVKAQFKFNPELVESLSEILPANELIIQNEVEKLILYQNNNKEITIEDIIEVFPDAGEFSLDAFCTAIIKKNISELQKHLSSIQRGDISYMLIVRVLANFFKKVLSVKHDIESGKTLDHAISSLKPPVFFKQRDNVMLAAKTLQLEEIKAFIKKIMKIELDCKSGLLSPELILAQNLILHLIHP